MNIKTKNDYWQTSSLPLVATISLYYPIVTIDKRDPRRAIFSFERDERLIQLVQDFWNNQLKVNPRKYFDQIKFIKSRLYENE